MSFTDFSLRGVITALVTPFDQQGTLDEAALERLVEFQIRSGVHGLNPCGTTGEHPLLSMDERQHIAEVTVRTARRRVPVYVQTGTPSTEMTLTLTRHAQKIGANAATIVTPFYYRYRDADLIEYYTHIASGVPDFPILLYNIPQHTGNNLTPAVVAAIAERSPNIVGIKDSSGHLQPVIDMVSVRDSQFAIAEGSDGLILSALVAGVSASVSGNANVFPELFVGLFEAFWQGDLSAARAMQARIQHVRRILRDGDLALFKALLARRGLPVGSVRSPLPVATDAQVQDCIEELESNGIALTPIAPVSESPSAVAFH